MLFVVFVYIILSRVSGVFQEAKIDEWTQELNREKQEQTSTETDADFWEGLQKEWENLAK